jgi:hypothetical protein
MNVLCHTCWSGRNRLRHCYPKMVLGAGTATTDCVNPGTPGDAVVATQVLSGVAAWRGQERSETLGTVPRVRGVHVICAW